MFYPGRSAPSSLRRFSPLLGATALFLGSATAHARDHRVEIDGILGYRTGAGIDAETEDSDGRTYDGRLSAEGSVSYGGIVGVRVQSNSFLYLAYSRQETTFKYNPDAIDLDTAKAKGSIEYFHFGGNLEYTVGRITPYFGVSIGATRVASFDTDTAAGRFSMALDGGFKIELFPFLHLRALARVPFTFPSGELYCYSSVGCVVIAHNSPLVQADFQAGVGLQF